LQERRNETFELTVRRKGSSELFKETRINRKKEGGRQQSLKEANVPGKDVVKPKKAIAFGRGEKHKFLGGSSSGLGSAIARLCKEGTRQILSRFAEKGRKKLVE